MKQSSKRVVLVTGIGTSPAVLTETVWALAHQKHPAVPDEIVVITTKAYPNIEIDAWNGWVMLNGWQVVMSRPCFAVLLLLASGVDAKEHYRLLFDVYKVSNVALCDWLTSFQEGSCFVSNEYPEDVSKVQSELRKKLKEAGFANVESLVPQRGSSVMFPVKRVKWRNRAKLADVCGNLFLDDNTDNMVNRTVQSN